MSELPQGVLVEGAPRCFVARFSGTMPLVSVGIRVRATEFTIQGSADESLFPSFPRSDEAMSRL